MFKANVLYDFEAQTELGEIDIRVGEVVSVTTQDAGEGWYKGTNAKGEHGLFPKDFVEPCDSKYNTSVSSSSLRPPTESNKNLHFRDSCWVWPEENETITQNAGISVHVESESDDEDSDANDYTEEAPLKEPANN